MKPICGAIASVDLLSLVGLPWSAEDADTDGGMHMSTGGAPVTWEVPYPDPDQPAQGYPVLDGCEHFELFHATPETGVYCHHPHITHQDGTFFATWSNHRDGEDGPGQRVLYSTSGDGCAWKPCAECFPAIGATKQPGETGRVLTANGVVLLNGTVYAIAEAHDCFSDSDGELRASREAEAGREVVRGRLGWGRLARAMRADGSLGPAFWLVDDPPQPIGGAPQYPTAGDPQFAGLARQLNETLADPLCMSAWDFRDHTAWTEAADGHQLCEPTVYQRPDGLLVKLSRDLAGSRRIYAALSHDGGKTWDPALQTDIPDQPSKAVAGTLPDGRTYLIGNQVMGGARDPLVISLSRDGKAFDWAAAIRHSAPGIRHPGLHKGPGSQYPSAVVADDGLWVIYSVGKEDVAVSAAPLDRLE